MKFIVSFCLIEFSLVKGSFSPQRTAMRDKLFFGIEDAPDTGHQVSVAVPPVAIPPASSQLGVNATAINNRDLNDYGSLGPPPEVLAKREEQEVAKTVSKLSFMMFGASAAKTTSQFTAHNVFNILSIVWLVGVLVGGFYFLRQAVSGGNRKYRIVGQKPELASKAENMRIDREAYIYVADG